MTEKYTYQDWVNDIRFDYSLEKIDRFGFPQTFFNNGITSQKDYELIIEKQFWTYEKALECNKKSYLELLISEINGSEFPKRKFEYTVREILSELGDKKEIIEEVLSGLQDFQNMLGYVYDDLLKKLDGKRNKHYQIYAMTIKNGQWVPNDNLLVASLLAFEGLIEGKTYEHFLDLEKVKTQKRGGYITRVDSDWIYARLKDYMIQYDGNTTYIRKNGKPVVSRFLVYMHNLKPEIKKDKIISDRQLKRRVDTIISRMTF